MTKPQENSFRKGSREREWSQLFYTNPESLEKDTDWQKIKTLRSLNPQKITLKKKAETYG